MRECENACERETKKIRWVQMGTGRDRGLRERKSETWRRKGRRRMKEGEMERLGGGGRRRWEMGGGGTKTDQVTLRGRV